MSGITNISLTVYDRILVSLSLSVEWNTSAAITTIMGVKIGEVELDTSNISQADMEKLKKMLPDLQQSGKLSQLDIILEAIQYIKTLQDELREK